MPLVSRHGPLRVKIDHDGKDFDDPLGLGYNEAACVIHTHTRTRVAISAMKCGLLPISQHAMRVQREVSYHDCEGIALDMDERTRLARDLGKKSRAMILRNHGLLTLGATVREAFELMYYLDCACWTAKAATMPVGKVLFAVIAQSSFFPPVRVTHGDG